MRRVRFSIVFLIAFILPAKGDDLEYFYGYSKRQPSLQEAKKDAENDARLQISLYIFSLIDGKVLDASISRKSRGRFVKNTETVAIATSTYTRSVLSGVKIIGDPEVLKRSSRGVEVRIKVAVDKKLIEEARNDFKRLMVAAQTVRFSSVSVDSPATEVIAEIAADTKINIGAIECMFSYSGMKETQSVNVGDKVHFRIDPTRLSPGKHTGVLELQMKKISLGIENVRRSITFEITKKQLAPLWFLWNGDDSWKNKWIYPGIRLGVSPRNYALNSVLNITSEPYSSFEIAPFCEVQISSLFSAQTELAFSSDKLIVDHPEYGTITVSSNTLSLPLLAKFTLRPRRLKSFYFAAFTGPNFIFPLGQMEVSGGWSPGVYSFSPTVAWTIGANAGRQLGQGLLFLDIRYNGDFNFVESNGSGQYRRNILSISLGYNYGLIDKINRSSK
jgi:hypothetical protein